VAISLYLLHSLFRIDAENQPHRHLVAIRAVERLAADRQPLDVTT
jgi:hypothetical protein